MYNLLKVNKYFK